MQWVYSHTYAGGGILMSILLVAHGLWAAHAILGATLLAAGQVRSSAGIMGLLLVPAVPLFALGIQQYGSVGAAVVNIGVPLLGIIWFYKRLTRQFGPLLHGRSMGRIGLAGAAMVGVHMVLLYAGMGVIVATIISVVAYGVTLVRLGEIGREDVMMVLPRRSS